MDSIQRSNEAEVKRVTEELTMAYEDKITSHLQRQASKLLSLEARRLSENRLPCCGDSKLV
ncbi:hypothetical protein, partial [Endozoicomonas sp. YOMI1]|uniref:hypothetical protein n=1 Tax=Endozoicomonas sp. YOMI1 TaxID=2828739 RepID=UPI0021486E26